MMLCDNAQVADGKLYILGGGWGLIGPDPTPTGIAVKIDVEWTEIERPHHWELFLLDEDGNPVIVATPDGSHVIEVPGDFQVQRPDIGPPGGSVPVALALNFGPLPLEPGKRFAWHLSIDGETHEDWTLSFATRAAAPTE